MLKRLFPMAVVFLTFNLEAKELKGVSFEDQIKVGESTLKLNGLGVRKAFDIFDVYIGGLYLAEPSKDVEAIVKSTTPKKIILKFKRFVEKSKLKDAWSEGFGKNAEKDYTYRPDLTKLNEGMSHMKEKEEMSFTFYTDKVDILVKDNPVLTISGAEFSKTMLKVFINNPPDERLKKGMLGLE